MPHCEAFHAKHDPYPLENRASITTIKKPNEIAYNYGLNACKNASYHAIVINGHNAPPLKRFTKHLHTCTCKLLHTNKGECVLTNDPDRLRREGLKLRSFRREVLMLRQEDLAKALGVSRSSVNKWETGKWQHPRNVYQKIKDAGLCAATPVEQEALDAKAVEVAFWLKAYSDLRQTMTHVEILRTWQQFGTVLPSHCQAALVAAFPDILAGGK